ncbi:AAA family ATPase [Vreelandella sp. V005]
MRESDDYYINKTPFIERLANKNKYYTFLAAGVFGKSLLLSPALPI